MPPEAVAKLWFTISQATRASAHGRIEPAGDECLKGGIVSLTDKARGVLAADRNCILNTDLDGVVAGALLQANLGWRIVGWCDCRGRDTDKVWIDPGVENLNDVVFVDMHVRHPDLACIEQHFVAPDEATSRKMLDNPLKINPNHASESRTRSGSGSYRTKYPFGTANLVLGLLENLGYEPDLDLNSEIGRIGERTVRLGDLLLRCDDTAGNTIKYRANAQDWWGWLRDIGGDLTGRVADKAETLAASWSYEHLVEAIHRPISELLRNESIRPMHRRAWPDYSHADFSVGFADDQLSPGAQRFVEQVLRWFGCDVPALPTRYRTLAASRGSRDTWEYAATLFERDDLFSYTFVDMKRAGLSYTLFESDILLTGSGS